MLVQNGIAAYKVGNKEEAVRLLGQALRENPNDETAWLYLGAALDDVDRKRQAFERVLQINPDNEKAKNALARLNASEPSSAPAGSGTTGGSSDTPKRKMPMDSGEGFALPVEIEGAPARLTIPYIIETAQRRINQAVQIYTNRDFELIVNEAAGATMWDSVFIAGLGAVALGAAELVGRLIGWPLGGFFGGVSGLIWPFLAAIITIIATGVGFATAVYASRWYLQNQNINVSLPQHSMYYALVFLPLTLVSAVTTFLANALGLLILCLAPIFLIVGIALLVYNWFLLKGAFDRVYGTENNRGLITAAVAVIGGWVGSGVVHLILNPIFRIPT
jgi:tetratricopeptide (TPR) repeat protein